MLIKFKNNSFQALKRAFKTEESKFLLATGLKIAGISFFINVFVHLILIEVMRLNYAFFTSHGFPDLNENNPFYDYILKEAADNIPALISFHVFLFFIGVYVGWVMLRPFRNIADYCEAALENPNVAYKIDDFSSYKLLTRFSEFFFEYLRESRKRGEIFTNSIPPQYLKIHKPVPDRIFILHISILLIIISLSCSIFISQNSSAMYANMIDLAMANLSDNRTTNRFFSQQSFIINDLVKMTVFLVMLFYSMLGAHLYAKVSGAAFGIFSTMRAYMKGNYLSRVHLIGYAYLRDYTRKLNKYLDYIHNNLDKDKPKG